MFGNAGSRAGRNWLHAPYVEWDPVNKQLVMSDRQLDGVFLKPIAFDATIGSEDYDLAIGLMAAGAAPVEKLRLSSVMNLTWPTTGQSDPPSSPDVGFINLAGNFGIKVGRTGVKTGGSVFIGSVNAGGAAQAGCVSVVADGIIGFSSSTANPSNEPDTRFEREAAGVMALRPADFSSTNTVENILTLRRTSSGTPAAGIGVSLAFDVETAASNIERGATIAAVTTDVGSGTEDFDLTFNLMAAGAAVAEALRITGFKELNPKGRVIEEEVILSDGANVTLDSRLGNTFKLTAAGNRTIDAPTNKPASGKVQKIVIMHEASGADRTLTLATGSAGAFRFGTDITALTATTNGLVDYIGCIYNDADDRWDVVSYVKGF